MRFDYYIPTKIIFGKGRLEELASEKLPGKKALIVITNGKSMKKFGYLERETESDPWTVITNTETNEKIGYGIPELFPVLSIVDAELMLSVPSALTAYQGMDAFFHSAEGYLAKVAQPASDAFALDSIRRITKYLPKAVKDGSDMQAREELAWASTQAGMVESTSCCISEHSMEHALSAYYPALPHGAGLIALSVPYFSYMLKKGREVVAERYMDMARAMGEENVKSPEAFIEALKKLIKNIGMDELKLSEWGLKKEDDLKLAKNSFEAMGSLYELDPVELNEEDARLIINEAIK